MHVGWVELRADVRDGHNARTPQLAHLEQRAVDVPRVLRRREAMLTSRS